MKAALPNGRAAEFDRRSYLFRRLSPEDLLDGAGVLGFAAGGAVVDL
jgi:hypothetical protein